MKVSESCGKFILGGEHSVIYQGRALAFPLPQLRLKYTEEGPSQKEGLDFDKIKQVRTAMGIVKAPTGSVLESNIPRGAGLGSSAALCTALARYHFPDLDKKSIAFKALEGEKVFHGRSSGVDPFVVSFEKALSFIASQKGDDPIFRELYTLAFQKANLCFVLKDSGHRHETSEIISQVQKVKKESPLIWEDLIDALASNANAMLEAFEKSPEKSLGPLMNDSHFRLQQLGVSHESLDLIVEDFRKQGALGAKLTGAGRGGFVLGLFDYNSIKCLPNNDELIIWRADSFFSN